MSNFRLTLLADPGDAIRGIAWWNSLPEHRRAYWLRVAQTAVPAHAWHYAKLMRELRGACQDQPQA